MSACGALGGHALDGDNLVRLVYVDEAGLSNPKQEPWLVVAGIIVHADNSLTAIERHLDSLVERFVPEEHKDGFVFHATELFSGGKVFTREKFPLEERLEIADALAQIPKRFGLQLAMGFVERSQVQDTKLAHIYSYIQCAMFVNAWMRLNTANEVCVFVVENNEQAKTSLAEVHAALQRPDVVNLIDPKDLGHFPFTKIKEDPLFQKKKKSSPLQLADFFAYVFKRRLMDDPHIERFIAPVRKHIIFFDDASLEQFSKRQARIFARSLPRQVPERSL